MNQEDFDKLLAQLRRHEGLSLVRYDDSMGFATIGYGHNINRMYTPPTHITREEAETLLIEDVTYALKAAKKYEWFDELNGPRKGVIVNMIFNLGPTTFAKFVNTQAAIANEQYTLAATRMLQSRWAKQVGRRASELAKQMRTGKWE